MKYQRALRITAYFMLITGLVNLLMWLFLITSGQVENFESQPVAFIFHWISEFTTAVLLIIAGIHVLRINTPFLNIMFLALGFLLMAIAGAFYFYLLQFETAMFLFTALFTLATIVFIIVAYRQPSNFIFLASGLTLYGLINVMGQGFQEGNQTLISMSVPATVFLLVFVTGNLRREIRIERTAARSGSKSNASITPEKPQEQGP